MAETGLNSQQKLGRGLDHAPTKTREGWNSPRSTSPIAISVPATVANTVSPLAGRIAAAQQHALAIAKAHGVGLGKPHLGQFAERELDGIEMRVAAFGAALFMGRAQIVELDHRRLVERADQQPAQADDMAARAERPGHVAGDCPHIGALAAFGREDGGMFVRHIDEIETVDLDRTGLEDDVLAVAGKVIGAFAFDFDRREGGRHLHDLAGERAEDRLDRLAGRPHVGKWRPAGPRRRRCGFPRPSAP